MKDVESKYETITIKEAHELAKKHGKKVSMITIRKWVYENKLGHQPGGNGGVWYVFKQLFLEHLNGENILEETNRKSQQQEDRRYRKKTC